MADSSFDENVLIRGPSFHVDLAALDALHPVHYQRRLLIFRCDSTEQRDAQLYALKIGLQALVNQCPILGGIVTPLPPDEAIDGLEDWRTIVPDRGLELVVKDLRSKMPSFRELEESGFHVSKLPNELLVPIPGDISNDLPFAACKAQFSAIEGGTIVTLSMSHSVADGSGANEITRVLSEETRLAQERLAEGGTVHEVSSAALIGMDRSVLRDMKSDVPFDIKDHPAFTWKSSQPANNQPHPFEATSPEIPVHLRIYAASLAQLKADATSPGAPPISTHDAIAALMWRSALLIRSRRSAETLPASTTGDVFMPSDARRHLNLPQSYVGNAVYQLTASLDFGSLFSPLGLQHAASAIRRSITSVNPELVSSCIAMTNEKWVHWQFLQTMSSTGLAMGTDWSYGELYSHDWGKAFGPLVRFRYPGAAYACIFPKLPDGTAEVLMSVMPQEVETLKGAECFGKYIESPSSVTI
ncbi:hypothetical protein SCHPADRAFT_300254 [Schizopora paradoxa]|uniref:Trichothecene 3-O-acetyltransferase n=1 Tax=Schizopora paradoxa TaxID=27342 RepID=A0A0H2RS22_9AGAM|nr:hypothetical protein SCHPADRAFT_300254 [Schizopora paradoxa]